MLISFANCYCFMYVIYSFFLNQVYFSQVIIYYYVLLLIRIIMFLSLILLVIQCLFSLNMMISLSFIIEWFFISILDWYVLIIIIWLIGNGILFLKRLDCFLDFTFILHKSFFRFIIERSYDLYHAIKFSEQKYYAHF